MADSSRTNYTMRMVIVQGRFTWIDNLITKMEDLQRHKGFYYRQIYILEVILFLLIAATMSRFNDSPEREGQNSTHATGHLTLVDNLTREADKDLQQYHKLIELFRQELNSMKTKIENINEQIVETTTPLVESLYRTLQLGMINQKEQNNNFQEQLTDLKKEKSILSQMIVASLKRTDALHDEVGHY